MKVRIYANSIRLRLSQREVQQLSSGVALTEKLNLVSQPLRFELIPTTGEAAPAANFDGATLTVTAGSQVLARWAGNGDVAIESAAIESAGGESAGGESAGGDAVRVLIEKDFQCLHGDGENQPDCYPNPLAAVGKD